MHKKAVNKAKKIVADQRRTNANIWQKENTVLVWKHTRYANNLDITYSFLVSLMMTIGVNVKYVSSIVNEPIVHGISFGPPVN